MPFTVEDFHDLIRLLEERPDWRADLRRLVLTEELLGLPGAIRELAEAQQRSEARLAGVEARLERVEARLERVEARLEGIEDRLARLEVSHARLEEAVAKLADVQREMAGKQERMQDQLDSMAGKQERMQDQLDSLRGEAVEDRYRKHAGAYFGGLVRRTRLLSDQELASLLDDALDAGTLSRAERDDVLATDLVVRGRRWEDGRDLLLAVEVSVGIGPGDVERATRRAAVLGKIQEAVPVVAGERLTPEGRFLAQSYGVATVLDGRSDGASDGGAAAAPS
jgi:predicted nuclease with TOPRIM domain